MCVNDEACERFAKAGGLEEALAWAAPGKDPKTALAALRALGQVAGNDGNRAALVRLGYLELVPGLVLGFFEAAGVVEAALRVLGMVLLRNPEAAEAALECGALGAAAEALGGHGGHAGVCRQVCQVVRNAVVRSPGVKEALLRVEGLETGIRAARMKHGECKDVGGAALRDLGLEYLGETEKTDGSLDYYYNAL